MKNPKKKGEIVGHLPRNSAAAFDINYTINRSRWHAGRPSGLGHEWVGFLFITKREPSHAMNEFPTAPPSGGADTLDGGFVYFPRVSKKKKKEFGIIIRFSPRCHFHSFKSCGTEFEQWFALQI